MEQISALFAIEVEELIKEGRIKEAITLCERGLEIYPDYATAVALLAKAYSIVGNFQQSGQVFEKFTPNIIQTNITRFQELVQQHLDPTTELTDNTQKVSLDSDIDSTDITEEVSSPDIKSNDEYTQRVVKLFEHYSISEFKYSSPNRESNVSLHSGTKMSVLYSDANNLRLAPKYRKKLLKNISIVNDEFFKLDDIRGLPVTETYANILIKQGNFSKAKAIFRELSKTQPEKADYYEGLINKIN